MYGNPATLPVTEETPTKPINPYGAAKLMAEDVVRSVALSTPGFQSIVLRYFNVYGSDPAGRLGACCGCLPVYIALLWPVCCGYRQGGVRDQGGGHGSGGVRDQGDGHGSGGVDVVCVVWCFQHGLGIARTGHLKLQAFDQGNRPV